MRTGELIKVYFYWTGDTSCSIQVRDLLEATFKILPTSSRSEAAVFKKLCPFVLSHAKLTVVVSRPYHNIFNQAQLNFL